MRFVFLCVALTYSCSVPDGEPYSPGTSIYIEAETVGLSEPAVDTGSPCSSDDDCNEICQHDNTLGTEFTGGYCTYTCHDKRCPGDFGNLCIGTGDFAWCMKKCSDDSQCREEWFCREFFWVWPGDDICWPLPESEG